MRKSAPYNRAPGPPERTHLPAVLLILAVLLGCSQSTRPSSTAAGSTAPESTAPGSTAAGSTAPGSTAPGATTTVATTPDSEPDAPQTARPPAPVEVFDEISLRAPVDSPWPEPGALVRFQHLVDHDSPEATRYRVLYTSTNGLDLPSLVSGLVTIPTAAIPPGGWPLLLWGHGTTGAADICAPSATLAYPPLPEPLVAEGFVVAATDYLGLGMPGAHAYLDGPAAGRAMLDIAHASEQLPNTTLSHRIGIWGHSQGGHAAVWARQLAATRLMDWEVVGTVAIAPPANIAASMRAVVEALPNKAFAIMTLTGIAGNFPAANLDQVLTPAAAREATFMVEVACANNVDRQFFARPRDQLVINHVDETEPFRSILTSFEPAMAPGVGPLLLVHGDADATVPVQFSAVQKERVCGRGENAQRWVYPGMGHVNVIDASWQALAQWTRDRFNRVDVVNGCQESELPPPG